MSPRVALAFALALAGCPTRPAVVSAPPPPPVAARFVPADAQARGEGARGAITFTADGAVTRDSRRVATVSASAIADGTGAVRATLAPDGTIWVTGSSRSLRVVDGEVVRDDGARVGRDANGAIVLRDRDGGTARGPWRVEAITPTAGAPAVIVTLLLLDGLDPAAR